MAFSAKPGTGLFLFLQELFMATHALTMESLLQIDSRLQAVAGGTADLRFSLLQFALVEDVFPVFKNMMTILAGEPGLDVTVVRERDGRSAFPDKVLRMIQDDLVRLSLDPRSG